jgi:single-strand DNA-binding protein|tara:strand:- start:667 stop:1095 length:429 start_codon:yes stop_codon:yes gene_type:complete
MINKVILIGNIGAKPEIRKTQNGDNVASFTIATNENWKDQQGQQQTRTEWHKIVIFGKLTQIVESYLDKGSKIYIEGQLRTRKWTNQQGQDQYSTEVVLTQFKGSLQMLDSKPSNESNYSNQSNSQLSNRRIATVVDDEIPF